MAGWPGGPRAARTNIGPQLRLHARPPRREGRDSLTSDVCFRNVGPQRSRDLPEVKIFILSRFLTAPGRVEAPPGPKTAKNLTS